MGVGAGRGETGGEGRGKGTGGEGGNGREEGRDTGSQRVHEGVTDEGREGGRPRAACFTHAPFKL